MIGIGHSIFGLGSAVVAGLAGTWLLRACVPEPHTEPTAPPPFDAAFARLSPLEVATLPLAVSFSAPMGAENGALTYNARSFQIRSHLGDDLNGIGGGNSDFGDPVFASGDGRVVYTGNPSEGWGNIIMLAHRVPIEGAAEGWRVYITVYAHLDSLGVKHGDLVRRGQKIATVGTANGKYFAHLHFEVRESRSLYPGMGYAEAPLDRVPPERFLRDYAP
jgi:hypothetical protein